MLHGLIRTIPFLKIGVGASLALFLGCSSQIPLTPAVIREYHLNQENVKKLQLYISDGLLLELANTRINKDVDSTHSLKTTEDNYVKQIYFKKKTPCVAVEVRADKMQVAFEPESRLSFDLKADRFVFEPDKKSRDSKESKRLPEAGYPDWVQIGSQQYRDSTYNVLVNGDVPYLLADQKGLKKLVVESRAVHGMRQNGE